jgi:hypoxanthine phosphoribosyltransferase
MVETIPPSWKGLQTDRMPGFISYDQVERIVGSMLGNVFLWGPDAVVAIVRGGLVPGTMVSCMMALQLYNVSWNRTTEVTSWIGPPPDVNRLLLVDDCCATGRTMASVRSALLAQGYDCATLTVVYDPETTCYVPDYSQPMKEFFRFPWERGEATPAARRLRATGAPADRSTELPFFGLDLDGVFLPQISRQHDDADSAGAPGRLNALRPNPVLPPFPRERAVVITGHAEGDRVWAEAQLAGWGFQDLTLECRPHHTPDDIIAVARYKAMTATRWGCTHFIVSDPEQAIRIAAAAPHLMVVWWSAGESRTWLIGAATQPGARNTTE